MQTAKDAAQRLIEQLPEEAGWDDIVYRLHVRRKIEAALAEARAGRIVAHTEVEAELLVGHGD